MIERLGFAALLLSTVVLPVPASADETKQADWPQWRGPTMTGSAAPDADPPTEWGESKNVRWKVKLPGRGSSTPIVSGDRIFIQTAVPATGDGAAAPAANPPATPPAPAGDRPRGEGRGGGRGRGGVGGN